MFLCRLLVKPPHVKIMVRVIRFMKRTNTNVAVHLALQELTAKSHLVSSVVQTLAFGSQSLHYAKQSRITYISIYILHGLNRISEGEPANLISYTLFSNCLKIVTNTLNMLCIENAKSKLSITLAQLISVCFESSIIAIPLNDQTRTYNGTTNYNETVLCHSLLLYLNFEIQERLSVRIENSPTISNFLMFGYNCKHSKDICFSKSILFQ